MMFYLREKSLIFFKFFIKISSPVARNMQPIDTPYFVKLILT
jgi:hypothetical protein